MPLSGTTCLEGRLCHNITFTSLCVTPLAREASPFHFIIPKCIFLTAYFLEHVSNFCDGSFPDEGRNCRRGNTGDAILLFSYFGSYYRVHSPERMRANTFQLRIHQEQSQTSVGNWLTGAL